jgi:anti-anti-sigma regulatory factor
MEETDDPDGVVRLALVGELDLDVQELFVARLRLLKRDGRHVRLDISRLTFLDVAALRAVIVCLSDARRDGWDLELGRDVTAPVQRLVELAGVRSLLWPVR